MRDIINKLSILTESTGLAGRKSGDKFKNPDGDEITFKEIQFFPETGGRLSNPEIDELLNQFSDVTWMNERTSRTGGIAVASFTGPEGEILFGRYMEQIKPNFAGNYVPNQVGSYKFAGKSAEKAQSGLTPQDLLQNKLDLTSNDILNELANSLGTNNPLYVVTYKLAMGEPLPMTFPAPDSVSFTAFRDYFCEILQPIALQQGQYTGNAGEAAEIFLGGSFDDTVISFDDSKNAGLSDSIISNSEGKSIKVSSKGGKGATASTSNLVNSIDELQSTDKGRKLVEKYSETIDIIREVQKRGQAGAPLYLGVKYDIIDEEDANIIKNLKNERPINIDDLDQVGLSKNLIRLAKGRKTDNPEKVNLYYHLIAAIAHKAADEVNDKTDFSKAAADILNNGALVQVYTKAKEKAGNWTLEEFDTVYPGESIKGVYLSAGKTYYSTGIKGNFTFKIDRGQGKPKDSEDIGREKRTASRDDLVKQSKEIALGTKRPTLGGEVPTGNVGREKRK